jgi:hypothetical protein
MRGAYRVSASDDRYCRFATSSSWEDRSAAKTLDKYSSFESRGTGTLVAVCLTRLLYRWSAIVQSNELQRFYNLRSSPGGANVLRHWHRRGHPPFSSLPPLLWDTMNQSVNASRTAFRTALRPAFRQPLFPVRARQKCHSCGHQVGEHVGFHDTALAEQLSLIHGGCLDCESCGNE